MNTTPEPELDLELAFLPAWARQSPDVNRYADYQSDERDRPVWRRDRPGRPDRSERRADRLERRPDRPPRPPSARRPDRPPPGSPDRPARGRPEERRAPLPPLPELDVMFTPEAKGVESLARQIRLTGRAYPMFEIGHLVLRKPDRYQVTFSVVKKADGQVAQPLWLCNLDESLWLSETDAVQHVLRKHLETFYQAEKTPTDPPKGTYTFVAQCGLSGVILGPPNYHDYQAKLRKLHATRFARMPFEVYRSKVRIVRDEAVVKQWIEEQSYKTEYVCLNVPEALKLSNRDELEKHFREVHLPNIIRTVESWTTGGTAAQAQPAAVLRQILRRAWDDQQRFPLRIVNALSQQFAGYGLQFFKVNKTITHVAVARPHYLDLEATPVSAGVKRIVDHIHAHPGCNRRQLVEALAPSPPAAAPAAAPPASPAAAPATGAAAPSPTPAVSPTPEQTAVIADLHWLIHQGHVIEFANGRLETARKPKPRPPKPETPPAESPHRPAGTPEALVDAEATASNADTVPTAEPAPESGLASEAGEVVVQAKPMSGETSAPPTPTPSEDRGPAESPDARAEPARVEPEDPDQAAHFEPPADRV